MRQILERWLESRPECLTKILRLEKSGVVLITRSGTRKTQQSIKLWLQPTKLNTERNGSDSKALCNAPSVVQVTLRLLTFIISIQAKKIKQSTSFLRITPIKKLERSLKSA